MYKERVAVVRYMKPTNCFPLCIPSYLYHWVKGNEKLDLEPTRTSSPPYRAIATRTGKTAITSSQDNLYFQLHLYRGCCLQTLTCDQRRPTTTYMHVGPGIRDRLGRTIYQHAAAFLQEYVYSRKKQYRESRCCVSTMYRITSMLCTEIDCWVRFDKSNNFESEKRVAQR